MPSIVVPKFDGRVERDAVARVQRVELAVRSIAGPAPAPATRCTVVIVTGLSGRNRTVGRPAHPPQLHGDVRPAVEDLGGVEVGEGDGRVDGLVRREGLHDRAREVLPRLDHRGTERIGAVGVGREVAHPIEGAAHVVDRAAAPRRPRWPDIAPFHARTATARRRRDVHGDRRRAGPGLSGRDAPVRGARGARGRYGVRRRPEGERRERGSTRSASRSSRDGEGGVPPRCMQTENRQSWGG